MDFVRNANLQIVGHDYDHSSLAQLSNVSSHANVITYCQL